MKTFFTTILFVFLSVWTMAQEQKDSIPKTKALDINPTIVKDNGEVWLQSGICKPLKWEHMDNPPINSGNADDDRHPFLDIHGNVQYDFLYRSFADTPYYQKDFRQHTIRTALNVNVKDKYPLRVNLVLRKSNSPYFKDFFDAGLSFDKFAYNRNEKQRLFEKIKAKLPEQNYLAAANGVLDKELKKYIKLKAQLRSKGLLQELVEEREKTYFKKLRSRNKKPAFSDSDKLDSLKGRLDSLTTKIDSIKTGLQAKVDLRKKQLDSLQNKVDSLQQVADSIKNLLEEKLAFVRKAINTAKNSQELKKIASEYAVKQKGQSADKFIDGVRSFGIGRSMINYSEQKRYKEMVDNMETAFEASYREKCLSAKNYEQFTVGYANKEYHYTLYYYDAAGGLLMTVPPKGVRPVFTDFADVENARTAGTSLQRDHQLVSAYLYNSLGSPWLQISPDAGVSSFWYDKLGRLVVSQNAQQNLDSKFSYTLYDELGRITEVGQKPQEEPMTQEISQELVAEGALNNWIITTGSPREQMTITQYDLPFGYDVESAPTGIFNEFGFYQNNMRNRVSYTLTKNLETDADPDYYTGTFYTYDVHGNVESLLQRYPGINDMESTGNGVKRIAYDYDLISGKVNMVSYQPDVENTGQGDMEPNDDKFFQRYQYDAENKLISVETSRDKIEWEREAAYTYYKHGPLNRMELGQKQVQGLDYAYTLQGWLKGVNGTTVTDGSLDMGHDGYVTEGPTPPVARDVFGFGLHYYDLTSSENPNNNGIGDETDYKNIAQNSLFSRPYNPSFMPLYNGNIAGMSVNIAPLQQANPESAQAGPLFYNYRYDQLNRLKSMEAFTGLNVESGQWEPVRLNDFAETIKYDPNGNITHYTRSGNQASSEAPDMDNLDYQYPGDNNRLTSVADDVMETYDNDIENTTNYQYDQIGNLTGETNGSLTTAITWTLHGKIASVTKDGHTIYYTYDASGNRITKSDENKTTVYVRDASGNVMSIYERPTEDAIAQTEIPLYGSSRLGMATRLTVPVSYEYLDQEYGSAKISTLTRGEKLFELSNHLGNILAIVTDRKIQNTEDESTVSYFNADVANVQDYFPGGMYMPSRSYRPGSYRYGFNSKENEHEINGPGDNLNFEGRIYDARLNRWFSADPMAKMYPEESPYNFALNNPIYFVDPDGRSVEPAEEKGRNLVSNSLLGLLIHSAAKEYFDQLPNWRGEVTFSFPLLSTGRADLVYDAVNTASIWEIKPVTYNSKTNGKHELAQMQLTGYLVLAQSAAIKAKSPTVYSIGTSGGNPAPIKGTLSLTVSDETYNYKVSLFIPAGQEKEGLIYYTIDKAEKIKKSVKYIPKVLLVPKPEPITGYPGQGIGDLISKGIEKLTGKKIPIPDPVPVPIPAHVPIPAY